MVRMFIKQSFVDDQQSDTVKNEDEKPVVNNSKPASKPETTESETNQSSIDKLLSNDSTTGERRQRHAVLFVV